jgi:hypothetical protein
MPYSQYIDKVEWLGTMWSHAVVSSTPVPDIVLHIKVCHTIQSNLRRRAPGRLVLYPTRARMMHSAIAPAPRSTCAGVAALLRVHLWQGGSGAGQRVLAAGNAPAQPPRRRVRIRQGTPGVRLHVAPRPGTHRRYGMAQSSRVASPPMIGGLPTFFGSGAFVS